MKSITYQTRLFKNLFGKSRHCFIITIWIITIKIKWSQDQHYDRNQELLATTGIVQSRKFGAFKKRQHFVS